MHLLDINEIAKKAGIPAEYVEPYGKLKAKVDMKYFDEIKDRPDGKLVLVTAITPTKAGEGKTTRSVRKPCFAYANHPLARSSASRAVRPAAAKSPSSRLRTSTFTSPVICMR